jgi:hypothetical protein
MEKIIDQRVALALSKQSSQQGPNDEMSPSNKRKNSAASIDATLATTKAETLAKEPTSLEATQQCYLVDDITVRSACELLSQLRNKMIVMAYGVAEKPAPGETFMGHDLSAGLYPKFYGSSGRWLG